MMMIRGLSSTALAAVLIFVLFPSDANGFFGTCLCPAIMPANGATGSANCQTGATCDPSKLQEHACTVSCIQPFAQPVYKTGLSWLTADKINCTNGVFYANNKIINPTKLNCMILPRCDQCTYTMYSSECPEGYSCHPALLETNPYTNCTTVRCPNGYDGLIKHSDSPTVTDLDSTLTCTSVNKRWKDYFGTSYANNPSLRCAVRGAHPPTTTTTTSTTTTTTTSATTTTTMTSTAAPEGCLIPPNTPCDMPPEKCTSDLPIPDYTAGEMRCPSTSSLYVARTDTIGNSEQYRWAGSIRCMVNGLWLTTADPTPREYRYGFKIFCGVPPPETATYPGCDSPPFPPLLSPCPGASCSSIANATFVNYYGCKGLECPNDDQRIAVEGAAGTGTHIRIETPTTYKLVDGNLAVLGVFPWSTPAACVTYATTTTTMTPTTTPQGCPIPANTPCDMSPERCTSDTAIPDYTTGHMRCPPTSTLYVARTDSIGKPDLYSWAGTVRCGAHGHWHTTAADLTARVYTHDSFKMICALPPPESPAFEGCDAPPSPPLLSSCPGYSCSSIANATFVNTWGCKSLECPYGDQRIAVEGAEGTGTHIAIETASTYRLFNGNQADLGVFPWTTPAACVIYV